MNPAIHTCLFPSSIPRIFLTTLQALSSPASPPVQSKGIANNSSKKEATKSQSFHAVLILAAAAMHDFMCLPVSTRPEDAFQQTGIGE